MASGTFMINIRAMPVLPSARCVVTISAAQAQSLTTLPQP
jgi:hypothetical protein